MNTSNQKASLKDQINRLEAIISRAMDGIITCDEEGIIESINPVAAALFGYEQRDLLGENINIFLQYFDVDQNQDLKKILGFDKIGALGIRREFVGRRKDGSSFPFRISLSGVQLNGQQFFTGIIHDLTEQGLAEKKMWQEKERAEKYLEVANTIIVALDEGGRVILFNQKGEEILGYKQGEILGQNWFEIIAPKESVERVKGTYNKWMQGKLIPAEFVEDEIITKSGEQLIIAWHNSLVYDDEGNITGVLSSGNDVTNQKENEAEIIKLNAQLELRVEQRTEELADTVNKLLQEVKERKKVESALRQREEELKHALEQEKELNELKSRFVSMASHEFRTPLSTIMSSAALLGRYTLSEQQERRDKHIKKVKSAVTNLNGILNDFLSLSKLEEGKVQIQHEEFEFNVFCREVIEQIEGILKKGQEIEFIELQEETKLRLDSRLLKNCLLNLLSNASKYSKEGQKISLISQTDNQNLIIKVKDRGIGIPEGDKAHMFTRFFRAKNVINIKGTGLGLTIVKRYLDLMEGEISFSSKEGEGTTFKIVIPLKKEEGF